MKLISLNLFRTQSTNGRTIRKQVYATRLYLVSLIIICPVLVLYTLLNQKSITLIVQLRDLQQYNDLRVKYPTTVSCPCSDISISYDRFIELDPVYHQICSSDFVTQQWSEYLYDASRMYQKNYHSTASVQFQILSVLCEQAQQNVNNSLVQFFSTKFISGQLVSADLLQIQVESIVASLRKATPQTFRQALAILTDLIYGNAFMNAYETNWKFTVYDTSHFAAVYTNPQSYGSSCNCATSPNCAQVATLVDQWNSTVPGLLIGCYPHVSMLQSTLACLYDQQCLDLILNAFWKSTSDNNDFRTLNSSLLSTNSVDVNETVQAMVNRLFVDRWHYSYSYQKYYEQCRPSYCTYSYIQNSDAIFVVTTLMALYGGIAIMLKILSKLIINVVFWFLNLRNRKIAPTTALTG